jgi:hypothetical protein
MPSSGGGSTKTQTVSSNSAPWGPTQPGLKQAIGDAGSLYKSGGFNIPYYPQNTVAATSPETSAAWNAQSARATAGSPNLQAAQAANLRLLNGDYSMIQQPIQDAIDTANSNSSLSGRYGSNVASARGISQGVGSVIAPYVTGAIGAAPTLAQADYLDPQMLAQVGQQRENTAQANINADMLRYNANKQAPIDAIDQYMRLLSGNWGGSQTTSQPVQNQNSNPWLGLAGLAAQGAGSYFGA